MIYYQLNKGVDNIFGTLTDENVTFFKTNTPCGVSPEVMVKVYSLDGSSPYNKVKVCLPIVSSLRDDAKAYTPR